MVSFGPQIYVIAVSYNTRAMTLACLGSVLADTSAPIVLYSTFPDAFAAAITEALQGVTLTTEGRKTRLAPAPKHGRQSCCFSIRTPRCPGMGLTAP